ncbi:MAG TPA: HAMP domain-containing protein, partial [Ilumatobacter sp.]|nr:HAMP domain-containing protein [Ilumatobacter sp.]
MSQAQLTRLVDTVRRMRGGDLSARLSWRSGALGELAAELNGLAAQHERFHRDAGRVAIKVVRHGRPDARLTPPTDAPLLAATAAAINDSMDALLAPGAEIARVIGAVAAGDLSARVITPGGRVYQGEFRQRAMVVDSMVAELSRLADELTRVTRQFGTEGRLGGQAQVPGVSGRWKELTDAVNYMVHNLTDQVRDIAQVTTAVANGDLTQKITADVRGEVLELKDTINTMVDQLRSFAAEVTRVAREVGTEGRLGGQAQVAGVSGTWRDLTESVNSMAGNLTTQVRDIATVTTAVANGDLSQKISVEAKGEVAALAETINRMVDQLRSFADEVTRVAREVGTEGRLGGQAQVQGVSGTWKDLTENVNQLAGNLTAQVRNIAQVTTAVANGDLSQTISVDARGEILELKATINTMVDQLSSFAAEVTRVAREVGTEG